MARVNKYVCGIKERSLYIYLFLCGMKSDGSRFNLDIAPNSQILLDDKLLVADENVPPSITLIHNKCPG